MSQRGSYRVDGQRIGQARQALTPNGRERLAETDAVMTQQDLADRCGLHRVTLTRIENGHANVSREVLEQLVKELGRSREWLLGGIDPLDELAVARDRLTQAISKMGEGFEDFTAAVDVLYARAGETTPVSS